jgi:hypothetical protein
MTKIGKTDTKSTMARRNVGDHGIKNAETAGHWLATFKQKMVSYVLEVQARRTRCNKRQNTMSKPVQSSAAEQGAVGDGSGPVSWPERWQKALSLSAAFSRMHRWPTVLGAVKRETRETIFKYSPSVNFAISKKLSS